MNSPNDSELSGRKQPRFRPRPTTTSTNAARSNDPVRHQSEKQHSRRPRHHLHSSATASPRKFQSTKSSPRKALSTKDGRSVASADDWGGGSSSNNSYNLSYPDILGQTSFRDVIGGEEHVKEVLASHERKVETFMKEQKVKEGRRNNVKSSLATFLQANNPEDDSITAEDDDEEEEIFVEEEGDEELHEVDDDNLISDDEHERNEKDLHDSHNQRSPKEPSPKRIDSLGSKSSRRVTRTTRTLDKEQSSGGNNSNHSRKSVARSKHGVRRVPSKAVEDEQRKSRSQSASRKSNSTRRLHRVRRNTADSGDEASVDASSRRSRRGTSRVRSGGADDGDDRSVNSSHKTRTVSRPHSVDASVRRHRSRSRGPDQHRVPQRRRSHSRSKTDDDDKSVSSKVSHATASRRGRRPGKGPQPKKNLLPPSHHMATSNQREESAATPPSSPEINKHLMSRSMPSLANHLDSHRDEKRNVEADLASEASSSHFSSGTPQSTLLQFDPTSEDLVQEVNQKGAKKTSETFKHADGTESKLQISELAGLPTFEKPMTPEEIEALNASTQSLDMSVVKSEDEEDMHQSKTLLPNLRSTVFGKSVNNMQIPGEASNEHVRRPPRATKSASAFVGSGPPNKRGNIQPSKSMSFMQRVQNRKSQLQESMMNRSTRVAGTDHQALLEDEEGEYD
ncbi:hypothetical protein IV203_010514 [Nitzschia inconspicua]|uniref:Uncharacterized protein n=1 Tax=Nitzschia inconspicua TaxID=303405 RepID=A0A9K3KW56_9STRA|nr:hypothetical protein IV203_010514 [Nitzschia inconspicua]